ncbi:MAG: phosphoribosylglycinamide formyltransferase [Planctomycetota bacterium]|nr:phosphoribosylglycinamide formyltransferase [Planctomycetota bacterium]
MPLRVAALLSGSGRTLQNLLDLQARGDLDIDPVLVVGSRADAYGLERARRAGLPWLVVRRADFPKGPAGDAPFSAVVFDACRRARVDLVVLAGWLCLLRPIPEDLRGRILNIHPALLPAFAGKGFYGDRVHAAVLAAGATETGCTVHVVDDEYDRGPVLVQRRVPVLPDDDAATLAARVFEAECEAYPEAIRRFTPRG